MSESGGVSSRAWRSSPARLSSSGQGRARACSGALVALVAAAVQERDMKFSGTTNNASRLMVAGFAETSLWGHQFVRRPKTKASSKEE